MTDYWDSRLLPALLFILPPVAHSAPPVPFPVCTDIDCNVQQMVSLSGGSWGRIEALFHTAANAGQERQAIGLAVAELERLSGKKTGTWRDRAGNEGDPADPGQLDCIAESINSTTYLKLLQKDGLLQWHRVGDRHSRNPLLFNFHWTAVIEERTSGRKYAVDSWIRENGKPPIIQPLAEWTAGRDPE